MIRALRDEVERYGHYSIAAESMYDHPFQWGSKRIGPDLARVGGKYSNDWHYAHLTNAQSVVPESLMPHYAFLAETPLDLGDLVPRLNAQRTVGVPYTDEMIANAKADLLAQANPAGENAALLKRYPKAVSVPGNGQYVTEMDALVAYLQVLGTMVDFADPAKTLRGEVVAFLVVLGEVKAGGFLFGGEAQTDELVNDDEQDDRAHKGDA